MRVGILAIAIGISISAMAAPVTYSAEKSAPSAPGSEGQSADAFLHSIYDRYAGPHDKVLSINYTKARELERYFEPSLAKMIARDEAQAAKKGDEGTLEGDPFIDAQDWDIKSFDIQVTPVDANHATGVVKFHNLDADKRLNVNLVRVAGTWKIHDIDYGEGRTLTGLFKAGVSPKK